MNNKKIADENNVYTEVSEEILCISNEPKMTKDRKSKWKRILFGFIGVLVIVILGGVITFFALKLKGESNLKAEEQYITYKGEKYKYRDGIINILCLGIDKWVPMAYIENERGNIGMSDAIVLVSIDTERDEVKAFAIPRETVTEVQTITQSGELGSTERMRICIQYAYGTSMQQSNELTMSAVSNLLYDIQIQRCCAINLDAVSTINDAVGGVDVQILEDIEDMEPRFPYGETVHLEGGLALRFIQIRNKNILEGSLLRTERQKQYVSAFIAKAKESVKKDPTIPITLFQELQDNGEMCTDITLEDITYLMPEVLGMSFSTDIVQRIPGESVVGEDGHTEFQMDSNAVKEMIIDTFYEKV